MRNLLSNSNNEKELEKAQEIPSNEPPSSEGEEKQSSSESEDPHKKEERLIQWISLALEIFDRIEPYLQKWMGTSDL